MTQRFGKLVQVGLVAGLAAACTPAWSGVSSGPAPAPGMVRGEPRSLFRTVESSSRSTVGFEQVIARAAMADVVFFGEQHGDPDTHVAEFALLEGIGRRRSQVVLSLEMFERDVQPLLDDYLAGRIPEADFLARSRPWERYATDYRGLVMLARVRGWKVVAANVPRPIASAIGRQGLAAIDTLPAVSRGWMAETFACPNDAYFARFAQEMTGHSAGGGPPTAADPAQMQTMTQRFYEAQCIKDETMAESITRALGRPNGDRVVVHFNGAFHSDYGQGTAQRVRRRFPDVRTLLITAIPVADPATASLGEHGARADYVIFTMAPARKPGA